MYSVQNRVGIGFKLMRVNYFLSYRFGYPYFEIIYQLNFLQNYLCILVAVGSSGILKGKQKLGVTFNSDKLGGIDFTINQCRLAYRN